MCTVSVIRPSGPTGPWPADGPRLRLVFNRDERWTRAPGLPPVVRPIGAMQVAMPVDPDGSGTWVAANSAGLVFAVINDPLAAPVSGTVSRGLLLPQLAGCPTLDDVELALGWLDAGGCRPWRVLVAGERDWIEAWPRDLGVAFRRRPLAPATLLTSSSEDPERASRLRLGLFEGMVARRPSPAAQDAFHAHRWPHLPRLSVDMRRTGASTVSRTIIEVHDTDVRLRYVAAPAVDRTTRLSRLAPASSAPLAATSWRWHRPDGPALKEPLDRLERVTETVLSSGR